MVLGLATAGSQRANTPRVGVQRFEDLRVWQAAKHQCDRVGALLRRPTLKQDPALADQLNRAALSVLFNITEGFLRRRDKETMQFLRYAIASNGEVKAAYYAAEGRACLKRWRDGRLDGAERKYYEDAASMARDLGGDGLTGPGTEDGPRTKDGPRTQN